MAIAKLERDPARDSNAADLSFGLQQEVLQTADAVFWQALDRRSGKACVVRVIDAGREDSARRLGDLHRERTLAERIGHPAVLCADVPLIEGDRIFQLVAPEPSCAVEADIDGGRLAVLNLLVAAAAVLADAHSRGVFHGSFTRASCLRGSDGRLIVQGFAGDAATPAALRDGAALDHRAFLEFATEMLRSSGGPPPRLRRYFARQAAIDSPKPTVTALAELCAELRDSLEDTFPWPLAGRVPTTAPPPPGNGNDAAPVLELAPSVSFTLPHAARSADLEPARAAQPAAPKKTKVSLRAAPPPQADSPLPKPAHAVSPEPAAVRTAALLAASSQGKVEAVAAAQAAAATSVDAPEKSASRALRPWLALAVVVAMLAATIWYAPKRRSVDSAAAPPTPALSVPAQSTPGYDALTEPQAAGRERPAEQPLQAIGSQPLPARVSSPRALPPAATPVLPVQPATVDADAAAAQAVRARIASLVTGGNRALNALEPEAAAAVFAAALAISPGDRAAQEGRQRARRLQGVAALVQDARQASARGDHARAVQGYAQALSNEPRNRGLADALAAARRSVGRDGTGALLAEGHAALGAGRLEDARAAFEKALETDPLAPGARRAAEQAATAILLRDEAEARRATVASGGQTR